MPFRTVVVIGEIYTDMEQWATICRRVLKEPGKYRIG